MPTSLNVALGALSPARSGSGSALMTAMRQVGGTIGVAVLGTVLADRLPERLRLPALPAQHHAHDQGQRRRRRRAAKASGSRALLDTVRIAYVHGLDVMLWVCAGIAITSAVLALIFLPNSPAMSAAEPATEPADGDQASEGDVATVAR